MARPASGHWYFTLKDDRAQVRCAMFRGHNQAMSFRPKEGDQVVVTAKVSLYEGRGDYQLICDRMEEDGLGKLQLAFEELKRKLQLEGLFDTARKRPLPTHPGSIGVVTSETGAAIHDILTVLERRYSSLPVYIYPTAVQGQDAAESICGAIDLANRHGAADVLIVGRGGGSLEDLWPFNEERVARAILASNIPIVSAVGHEVDFSISDLVADHRAPTPSAAAELLSPDQQEIKKRLKQTEAALIQRWIWQLQKQLDRLNATSKRLRHPGDKIRERIQRTDELELRLRNALNRLIEMKRSKLANQKERLMQHRPDQRIKHSRLMIDALTHRLANSTTNLIERRKAQLVLQIRRLQDINPLTILERGYALVTDSQGKIIRNAAELAVGDSVEIRVQSGSLSASIDQIRSQD